MPRLITIDVDLLSDETRNRVLAERRVIMMKPSYRMNAREAAELYEYTYGTLKTYLASQKLKVKRRGKLKPNARVITHAAMRALIRGKKCAGRPREALRKKQTAIPVAFVNSAVEKEWDGGPPARYKYTVKPAAAVDTIDTMAAAPAVVKG